MRKAIGIVVMLVAVLSYLYDLLVSFCLFGANSIVAILVGAICWILFTFGLDLALEKFGIDEYEGEKRRW